MTELEENAARAESDMMAAATERRRAVDEFQNACLELAASRGETDVERQRCEALVESNARLEKEKEALTRRVSELTDELAAAKEELLDRLDAETQVRQFETMLCKVEEMKAGYERRIERLRQALKVARQTAGLASTPSVELMEIDMTGSAPFPADDPGSSAPRAAGTPPPDSRESVPRRETPAPPVSPADPESDWLQMLPE